MKIGQVTMYGDNYGACLQAYALQRILEREGVECELIDYHPYNKNTDVNKIKFDKAKNLGLSGTIKHFLNKRYIDQRKDAYRRFRTEFLNISNKGYYRDTIDEIYYDYDLFICGSDMIWSEEFIDDWDFYFLSFAKNKSINSYATSFGQNKLTEENSQKVVTYLNKFANISCREDGGVELLKQLGFNNTLQVVDPTLLLTLEEWNHYINNEKKVFNEDFVFAYLFGEIDTNRNLFFNSVENRIARVVFLPKFRKKEQQNFPIKGIDPFDFVRLFRDAKFIVTDTFHGLMFSIIFRKPFLVLKRNDGSNWSKYSDRMTSTMKMLGLLDRYVDADFRDFEYAQEFDYGKIEGIIDKKRNESLAYIKRIIGA